MKISAIIPAFNSGRFIIDAIKSIQAQTHPVDEIIVVDDGSTDNTKQIVQNLPGIINYIRQTNQGPSTARNRGIQAAQGDWIAFLDADDQWTADKTSKQLQALAKSPDLHLIAGDMREIDNNDAILTDSVLAKHQLLTTFQILQGASVNNALAKLVSINFIPTGTVLAKKTALLEAGMFNQQIRFGEDLELWAKIAAKHPITCLPEILMLRRQHGNNATQNTALMLEDLVAVMISIKHYATQNLKEQNVNPRLLVASAYSDLGYWNFYNGNFQKARCAFSSSLKEYPSKRAIIFLLGSFLPSYLIHKIRKIKQTIAVQAIARKDK